MTKNCRLKLALVLFLALCALALYLVIQESQDYTLTPAEENVPAAPAPHPNTPTPALEQEAASAPADLGWALERYRGKELLRVKTTEKKIALTFDAGANADGVGRILALLEEEDIPGTFFLTGKFIEKFPRQVQTIIESGGELGNHTYDHPYLTQLTTDQITEEINKTEDALIALNPAAGFEPFLRSPYGDRNRGTLDAVSAAGYLNIRWTVDSLGWKGTSGGMSREAVQRQVLREAAPGAIVLMHLGSNPTDKTHLDSEALPEIIASLRAEGYEFVTLSELLELEK